MGAGCMTAPAAWRPLRTKRRKESALERRAVKWARARGVQVGKLTECVGLPDRIFFVPGGKPLVPEFKAPGGGGDKDDPAQQWHVAKLKEQGYASWFCESWEDFLRAMAKKGVR